jgi:hypothetical protein
MAEQAYSARWNAEVPQFGMQALLRLAIWGGLATVALFAAAISAYSNAGSQRLTAPTASGQGTVQPRTSAAEFGVGPGETAEEIRRLAEAVRTLATDRDQVLTRIAALERNLDGVTGTIKRDRTANPPPAPSQSPLQNPSASTGSAPAARPETPPAAVTEAAISPPPTPASQPSGPGDAAQMAVPDAANRAVASASNPVRAAAPAEPLAAAAGLGVDVGGAVNYEGLRTLWRSTKNSDPALLDELYPLVAVRENSKTHSAELRLVVGPVADAETAARLCMTFSATHHYCQPVAFEGQRLSQIDTGPAKAAPPHRAGPGPQASYPEPLPASQHGRPPGGK